MPAQQTPNENQIHDKSTSHEDQPLQSHKVSIVEVNSDMSLASIENDVQDIVQQNMSRMEQERTFEKVVTLMRKKHKAVYEQVDLSFKITVNLC